MKPHSMKFSQPPNISPLLGSNILISTCTQTTTVYVLPLISETKFHAHKNYRQNYV
jgi:hypothetical protein